MIGMKKFLTCCANRPAWVARDDRVDEARRLGTRQLEDPQPQRTTRGRAD